MRQRKFTFHHILALLLAAASHARGADADPPYNPYADVLAENNVEPTLAGVTEYLRSLVPTVQERQRRDSVATVLIAQLGAANFRDREEAMQRLARLTDVPHDKLRTAALSNDPEIRWRSEMVLKLASRPNPLPEAVCRTIAIMKIKGAAPLLLQAIPELGPEHVRRAAEDALVATARAEDAELLLKAIDGDDLSLKVAAIAAFGRAVGEDSMDVLRPLMKSEGAQVQLAAAKALADLGDRSVLPVLLELLDSDDVETRAASVAIFRALTSQQFGFLAYDEAEKRGDVVAQWKRWIAEDGPTAKLTFPLPENSRRSEIGHTIILVYQQHKAIELNAAGETIWEKDGLDFPWAVQRLDNGNTVIGSYRGQYVTEFNPAGDEVWRKDSLPGGVFGVERLPNGNTLLGLHKAKKVIEINRAGETVWEATCDGQPMGVQRLANGNTMVALHSGNKVVEIDRTGKVVWEVGGLKIPRTVQRLPGGNTLISDSSANRAVEFDREKNIVWSYTAKGNVYEAQRLAGGNTLISDTTGVFIVDRDGKIVWEKRMTGTGRAVRF